MVVRVDKMTRDVRVAIDLNHNNAPLLMEDETDTLSFDEIIHAKLTDAARMVEMEAPLHLLEQGHQFGESVTWLDGGRGWTLLPDDFMRLVWFKMSDWAYGVSDAITPEDAKYSRQWSRWKGVCGNPERPVVAIVNRSAGNVLEFFSCHDDTAVVEHAVYIPVPRIDLDGGIDVSEKCYKAAVYRAGSLALASIGDQRSTTMIEISKSLLS